MAIKFEKIVAGMTLYDRHRTKMGNTTMSCLGEWKVRVLEVNPVERTALISWNGNAPRTQCARNLEKLSTWSMYDDDVVVTRGVWDRVSAVRKMTKAEKAARKAVTP